MAYANLNAYQSGEQKLNQLVQSAALNISSVLARMEILTDTWQETVGDLEGTRRDLAISLLYTMNENVGILAATGNTNFITAMQLQNPIAFEWYDAAIEKVQNSFTESDEEWVQRVGEEFQALVDRVNPRPEPPANAAEMDAAFADDDKPAARAVKALKKGGRK